MAILNSRSRSTPTTKTARTGARTSLTGRWNNSARITKISRLRNGISFITSTPCCIIHQYQVSTDKRSGITNDPNRADDPQYIVRLIAQVITVSMETVKLVRELIDFCKSVNNTGLQGGNSNA